MADTCGTKRPTNEMLKEEGRESQNTKEEKAEKRGYKTKDATDQPAKRNYKK